MSTTLSPAVLEVAAEWYVRLHEEMQAEAAQQQRLLFNDWLEADPLHRQAWARVEKLEQRFGMVPADIAIPTLRDAAAKRRAVLKTLALLSITVPAGWGAYEYLPWWMVTADYRTATGEQKTIYLPDGSILVLNTATAVDVDYRAEKRLIHLHEGEICITTAADRTQRPFVVQTIHGEIRALGTRFTVQSDTQAAQVAVLEHAVKIRLADQQHESLLLEAGHQVQFNRGHAGQVSDVSAYQDAWIRGIMVVENQALAEFIKALSRYRPGILRCDSAAADIRISGAFRVQDTDEVLSNIANTLPIKVVYRTRYWVSVTLREQV